MEVQAPPGFEKGNVNHGLDLIKSNSKSQGKLDCFQGKGKDSVSNSQNTATEPPGFEKAQENQETQVKTKPKQKQERKGRQSATRAPLSSSSTNETSESMVRLAQESLQVGELLGVRMIGDKKAAVARITDHLKKRKA